MDRHYSYEEVKGLKRLYEDDIEAGEKYCIPLPRWYGGDWNEQQFDILVADKPIKKAASDLDLILKLSQRQNNDKIQFCRI